MKLIQLTRPGKIHTFTKVNYFLCKLLEDIGISHKNMNTRFHLELMLYDSLL